MSRNKCSICGNYLWGSDQGNTCNNCIYRGIIEFISVKEIGNYYGTPVFIRFVDGSCAMELDDHSETRSIPISTELFEMVKKELTKT